MTRQGQAATELMIVLAVVLALLGTALVFYTEISQISSQQLQVNKAKMSLADLSSAALSVYQQGDGARTRVLVSFPEQAEQILFTNQAITLELSSGRQVYRHLGLPLTGAVSAAEGERWVFVESTSGAVQFSENITDVIVSENESEETNESTTSAAFNLTVLNLQSPSQGRQWIYWNWTNPSNISHIEIWLNGSFRQNITVNYYNATFLSPSANYQVQTRVVNASGTPSSLWNNNTNATITPQFTTAYFSVNRSIDASDGTNRTLSSTELAYLAADDSTLYTNDAFWPKNNGGYDETEYVEFTFAPNLTAYNLTQVLLHHIFQITSAEPIQAKVELWNTDNASWTVMNLTIPATADTDQSQSMNLTNTLTSLSALNSFKVRFMAYVITNKNVKTRHDYLSLNVTYES